MAIKYLAGRLSRAKRGMEAARIASGDAEREQTEWLYSLPPAEIEALVCEPGGERMRALAGSGPLVAIRALLGVGRAS